jgi:nitroreductase
METWDAITSRRNVRAFADRAIADGDLDRILEAGRRAPSSRNTQPWDFVVVTDRAQLKELSGVWRGGGHIEGAAAAVVFVIDESNDTGVVRYDLGQASMQMTIAAADLGIGSGHSSVGDQELAAKILGLPGDKTAAVINDFGYPKDRPLKPVVKPDRKAFDEVVHRGKW